jgi:hypothetical protein
MSARSVASSPASKRLGSAAHQVYLYYQAERRSAEVNETFLELVAEGLTREELARNIERRPSLWDRFSGWLDRLPSKSAVSPS